MILALLLLLMALVFVGAGLLVELHTPKPLKPPLRPRWEDIARK